MTEKVWESEPNFKAFMVGDYHCVIIRNKHLGHLCGYVGITEDHPYYAKGYGDLDSLIEVHGELTYSAYGIKRFNQNPNAWYFGFDCAHSTDYIPSMKNLFPFGGGESIKNYRTIEFVENELVNLVAQLDAIKNEKSENQKGD